MWENWIQNSFKEETLQIKYTFNGSFLPNAIFLLFPFMFSFVNIYGTHNLQKEDRYNLVTNIS